MMYSDNPNYFDEEVATKSNETNSKSFFLFKKRHSSGKLVTSKPVSINIDLNPGAQKRRGSLKGLLRSRSNSTTSPPVRTADTNTRKHNTLDYRNHGADSIRDRWDSYNDSFSENSANDDVFYSNSIDSKCSSLLQGRREHLRSEEATSSETRRHSIGTFMMKEHMRTGSISDEVPKMLAPKAPTASKSIQRHGESPMSAVDDILFVTSRHNEQAMMWVNHLKTCFDKITKQRGRLPFNFLHVKIDEDQITQQLTHRCQYTKLQIVIVCPTLLSLSSQFLQSNMKLLLKPERVLGMLLDVTETRVWEIHKATFPAYNKWRTCVVGDHEQSFVSELLGIATDILGRALRQQPMLNTEVTNVVSSPKTTTAASHSTAGHQEAFTLFPRKVKVGQSKIIAILNEPLIKDDWIKIKIEKANEIIEITNIKRRNPYTIQFNIPEHQRKINVANLPWDVTEQQLRDLFSGHEVEKVEIYHYRKYTLALVLFKDKDTAAAALAEKENSMFRDRRLRMHMEFTSIRHIKREVIVTVVEDENMTEEQLWDKVKAAGVEPTSVLIFYPLGYVTLEKECDKAPILEKLKAAGFNAHDLNQRDQNQHLDIWRAAKLFFRNRNRVQLLNIPNKWIEDKEEMKKQCAEGGTITEAVSNNVTQNPQMASNYARIFYETEEQAVKAAKALNGRVVDGKRIHALHLGSALMPNYKTSVYVTSLDKGVTEEQVYDHFKQFGEIEFTNRRNCGDAAIICYKNAASAEKALACTTFPAPTEENKDATKEVVVKKYDGPLVLRPVALKRKLKAGEEEKDQAEKTKEQQSVLGKLKAYHPIFVGNVPLNCPPLELKHYFAQHGPIKFMFSPQILAYRNSAPHPVKTFIIYYMNRPSQQNAVRFFDHKFFGGHRLHVLPLRGTQNMDVKKTIKMTKIPFMSEDALFKKIKPFVGKINRIVKKSRLIAYIELEDSADVEKMMNVETPDHPLPKGKMEQLKTPISARLYNEDDVRVLNGIAKIVAKNPDMLKKNIQPPNKRPRMEFGGPGFNQGPGGFVPNNNMNNPNAIQDLLRLAFMSGKNVGESLASNQSSFGPDPPVANSNNFGDGGFGNRNRNNQGGNQGNFRGQGRMNMNQNQNRGNNANNFGGNTNAGGNNFQASPGNQNRGGQNMNRGNQQNQNRAGGNMNQGNNMNQAGGGNVNRPQQNKPMNMNTGNQNQNRNNQVGGGGNMNRNQNQNNRNNFDNDNSFGGGNNFGNNRNNNFSNDSFGSNDNNFGGNNSGSNNFSNDNNFGGNNRGNNFGGNKRNQNDNFNNSFGSGNNSGGNNRFNNDGNNFNSNFNNRNQNNRFDNDNDNNFTGNKGGNNFGNRQNKPFNQGNNQGGNQGGGMSFGEFNNSNSSNRSGGNFGGNNSGFNSGNAGGNKWNNNSQQSNTGSRLAGSIFSRRF